MKLRVCVVSELVGMVRLKRTVINFCKWGVCGVRVRATEEEALPHTPLGTPQLQIKRE